MNKKAKTIEDMLLSHVCWSIWREHNTKIFQDKCQTVAIIIHKGIRSLKGNVPVCLTLDLKKYHEVLELLKSLPSEGPTSGGIRDQEADQ